MWHVDRKQGIAASIHLPFQDAKVEDAWLCPIPPSTHTPATSDSPMRFVGRAHDVKAVASAEFAPSVVAGNILRAMLNAKPSRNATQLGGPVVRSNDLS